MSAIRSKKLKFSINCLKIRCLAFGAQNLNFSHTIIILVTLDAKNNFDLNYYVAQASVLVGGQHEFLASWGSKFCPNCEQGTWKIHKNDNFIHIIYL